MNRQRRKVIKSSLFRYKSKSLFFAVEVFSEKEFFFMALALSCYIEANSPRWLSSLASSASSGIAFASRALCNCSPSGSRRKGSESFDEDSPAFHSLTGPSLEQPNFESDDLWAILRKLPGIMLWVTVLSSIFLPFFNPVLLSWIIFLTMFQNSFTLLFSMGYTYKGFKHIERSMSHPIRIPPLIPLPARGGSAVKTSGTTSSSTTTNGGVTTSSSSSSTSSLSSSSASSSSSSTSTSSSLPNSEAQTLENGGVSSNVDHISVLPLVDSVIQPAQVIHVISICRYTEPIEVLQETLDHLSVHSNRQQYIILLCLEAADKNAATVGETLVKIYQGYFMRVMYAIHPSGIETEVPGKSANVNWGARAAYAFLEESMGATAVDRMVISICDCDAKVSEHYFNELSVNFASAVLDKREVFWAPPMLFDEGAAESALEAAVAAELEGSEEGAGGADSISGLGGASSSLHDFKAVGKAVQRDALEMLLGQSGKAVVRAFFGGAIPAPVRLADTLWSTFHLQNLASVNWVRLPCSTYSVGFRLIASVGFWDTGVESVPEDYHTALKLYWATSGRCRCEPIYHPVLYQHIDGGSWWGTAKQRFHQGVRHMWGATDIAYILWLSIKAPIVPFWSRVRLVITVLDVHVNSSMSSFYSTLGFLVLQAFRSDWLEGEGRTFKRSHQGMIAFAFCISLATGLVYEWYALEMVAALKRRVHYDGGRSPSGSITGLMWESPNARSRGSSLSIVSNNSSSIGGGNPSSAATFQAHMHALLSSPHGGAQSAGDANGGGASATASLSNNNNMNASLLLSSPGGSGGASAMPVSPPLSSTSAGQFSSIDSSPGLGRAGGRARSRSSVLPRGVIESKDRSFMSGLSRATAAGAFVYFLKFLPWMWGPVVCIFCEFTTQ